MGGVATERVTTSGPHLRAGPKKLRPSRTWAPGIDEGDGESKNRSEATAEGIKSRMVFDASPPIRFVQVLFAGGGCPQGVNRVRGKAEGPEKTWSIPPVI